MAPSGWWCGAAGLAVALLLLTPRSSALPLAQRYRRASLRAASVASADRLAAFLEERRPAAGSEDVNAALVAAADDRCADALGVKTLLFATRVPDGVALAVVLETDRVDEVALAAALGVGSVRLAPFGALKATTGFRLGTLPPCGAACGDTTVTVVDERVRASPGALVGGGGEPNRRLWLPSAAELERLLLATDTTAASAGAGKPVFAPIRFSSIATPPPQPLLQPSPPLPLATELAPPTRLSARDLPAVDVGGERVALWGIVGAKRPMARTLCFVTLLPPPELLPEELVPLGRGWEARRDLWRPVGGATADAGAAAGAPALAVEDELDGGDEGWLAPVGVQLILGRSLEREIGAEALADLIRDLKIGSELRVVAAPAVPPSPSPPSPPPTTTFATPAPQPLATPTRAVGRRARVLALFKRLISRALGARREPAASDGNALPPTQAAQAQAPQARAASRQTSQHDFRCLSIQQHAAPPPRSRSGRRASAARRSLATPPWAAFEAALRPSSRALAAARSPPAAGPPWLRLPADVRVTLVDSPETAALAADVLLAAVAAAEAAAALGATPPAASSDADDDDDGKRAALAPAVAVLGLDVEWEPERRRADGGPRARSPPALLQLATRTDVLVLDLIALCEPRAPADPFSRDGGDGGSVASTRVLPAALGAALEAALGCPALLKLTLGGASDLRRLREGLPSERCFAQPVVSQVDVDALARTAWADEPAMPSGAFDGLSRLAAAALGAPLDKALQCASWGTAARPLAAPMVQYAALDAHVLTGIFDAIGAAPRPPTQLPAAMSAPPTAWTPPTADAEAVETMLALDERTSVAPDVDARLLRVQPGLDALLRGWLGRRAPSGQGHAKEAALLLAACPEPVEGSRAPAGGLRGYDRRGGLVELADAFAVFVSFPPSMGRDYFERRYPNALRWARAEGDEPPALELSWWLPTGVGAGHQQYAALLAEGDAAPRKERLLFARLGKGARFVFCGRVKFVRHLEPASAGAAGGGLVWELLDARALVAQPQPSPFSTILRAALADVAAEPEARSVGSGSGEAAAEGDWSPSWRGDAERTVTTGGGAADDEREAIDFAMPVGAAP